MGNIKIEGYLCERCKHEWVSRSEREPRVCPRCKSPYWNCPRRKLKKKIGGKKPNNLR